MDQRLLRSTEGGRDVASFCCLQFASKTLPWKQVQGYELTRSSCSIPACGPTRFITKKGRRVCVPQKEGWVQKYISLLKTQPQL
ncbi:C-C motif chemokine 26 [Erinaceus europaeus]|uniref:C-C motif chemokine 26 n=1 Tax=Erinaceus europaeus TaxID=9365 RepID=A0ABM3W0F5_ERIEU|nr:C-C motif chemokine 26 [Erinaceus europaeus]